MEPQPLILDDVAYCNAKAVNAWARARGHAGYASYVIRLAGERYESCRTTQEKEAFATATGLDRAVLDDIHTRLKDGWRSGVLKQLERRLDELTLAVKVRPGRRSRLSPLASISK